MGQQVRFKEQLQPNRGLVTHEDLIELIDDSLLADNIDAIRIPLDRIEAFGINIKFSRGHHYK